MNKRRQQRRVWRFRSAAIAWLLVACGTAVAGVERPPGLEPEIGFWRQVFTGATSSQALIHDDRHLGVVYERVEIPADSTPAQRRRIADDARSRYQRILKTLASGRRDGLSADEARVLALWPKGVSNEELGRAAGRIRFQQGLADRFEQGLARSGQWRDFIRKALAEQGVPAELISLPHVESSFNPAAHSHVGASGLWQFTRSTGRRFMQVDHIVDGRRDPFISSDAAARLLAYNYSILGSWPLAITAYNHGVGGMRRAVRTMGTEDIETIIRNYQGPAFGFASRNFFVAFMAAVEVEANAGQYFGDVPRARPRADVVIALPDYLPASALQDAFGVGQDVLKAYNPALLAPIWNDSKYLPRGFPLRLPADRFSGPQAQVLAAVPARAWSDKQTPDMYHRVERGDSLSVIAARYRTSTAELVALNGLKSKNQIRIGQVLRLPYSGPVEGAPIEPDRERYTVRAGDTLGGIAQRAGTSEAELMALNNISNRNRIYLGQVLRLQGDQAVRMASAAAAPVAAPAPAEAELAAAEVAIGAPDVPDPAMATEIAVAETVETEAEPAEPDSAETVVALLADPADYLVADDGTIEVQAVETLGHYADWLDIRTQRLRDVNGFAFGRALVIGERLKLDFGKVPAAEFAARRITFHREMQEAFFARYRVADTTEHRMRQGESLWILTNRKYKVPVWLLRQYNPDLDLDRVKPGRTVVFPRVEALEATAQRLTAQGNES